MTYEELETKYKEAKKWGYSMRDTAHKFDKELQKLKNRSCEGCIHKNENEVMDYDCFECSRYYTDRYEPKDKQ